MNLMKMAKVCRDKAGMQKCEKRGAPGQLLPEDTAAQGARPRRGHPRLGILQTPAPMFKTDLGGRLPAPGHKRGGGGGWQGLPHMLW